MKGVILGFDEESGKGHVRGEDDRRYAFTRADLRTQRNVRGGEDVDFDVQGDAAKDVYITRGTMGVDAAALRDAASRIGSLVGGAHTGDLPERLQKSAAAEFVLGRAAVFYSLLILLACFFTYYPSSFLMDGEGPFSSRIPLQAHSLYGTASYTSEWADKISVDMGPVEYAGSKDAVESYQALGRAMRVLLYLNYIVPLFALNVVLQEFRRKPSRKFWRWSGIVTVAMPVVLAIIGGGLAGAAAVSATTHSDVGASDVHIGVLHIFLPTAIHPGFTAGGVALFVAGLLSLLASFNRVKAPLVYLAPKAAVSGGPST
jgi:hypothetical protein